MIIHKVTRRVLKGLFCLAVGWLALGGPVPATAATYVLDQVTISDLNIPGPGSAAVMADFSSVSGIRGLGLITDWTAVVADNEDGVFPWSLDLRVTAHSPTGNMLLWDPVGGDRTIADYPLADFSPTYSDAQPGGIYDVTFSTPGVPNPYVSGLRNTTLYAMGQTDDVITEYDGSVAAGPMWNRPFYINGVSGLGPVVYDALEFTVPVSGGYTFDSVVPTGNNFNFLYRGSFDPTQPLVNLLDYGLGNGNAPNGTPAGTSRIDSLLLAGETYYYVTSQWDRFSAGQMFETTITGPAAIDPTPNTPSGDFNGDGDYACDDIDALVVQIVAGTNDVGFDLTGDGLVDQDDLASWLAEAGAAQLPSGNPYLPGDGDLSGGVDGADFLIWNAAKFTTTPAWCSGDFNASGTIDGQDFLIWNEHKFQSAARMEAVPEPSALLLGVGMLWGFAGRRKDEGWMKDEG